MVPKKPTSAGGPVGAWGLFGELDGAAVKDLRLRGELTAAEDSGVRSLGALAGTVSGDTAIGGCRSEAAVQSEVSGGRVGGVVGRPLLPYRQCVGEHGQSCIHVAGDLGLGVLAAVEGGQVRQRGLTAAAAAFGGAYSVARARERL